MCTGHRILCLLSNVAADDVEMDQDQDMNSSLTEFNADNNLQHFEEGQQSDEFLYNKDKDPGSITCYNATLTSYY